MRNKILSTLIVCCILLQSVCVSVSAQTPPLDKDYVIQVVTDGLSDNMFDQLKAKGAKTPNLDSIILGGSRFRNVETTVPSYAASLTAGMTGASAGTNECLVEYYDGVAVKTSDFKMQAETIFNKFHTDNAVNGVMAAGWRVGNKAVSLFNGFPTDDPNYVFKEHGLGDTLCSIKTVADDIIASLNSGNIPQFMSVYSNDITVKGWSSVPTDVDLITSLELIDTQIGRIQAAVTTAGIADNTTIVVNSLANATPNAGKVSTTSMATEITAATGVQVLEEKFTGKASIQKQYYLTYAQLYFMPTATQEDKQAVLNYLNTDGTPVGDAVERVVTPAEVGAPDIFADYIICPVQAKSFCAAGTNVFRVDDMHNKNVFCAIAGAGAPKRSSIENATPTILDIVPTICSILGANVPTNNEGTAWTYQAIQKQPVLTVASPENNKKVYAPQIEVVGIVDYPCIVKVNNNPVTLNGVNFTATVALTEGENKITVTAENSYGTVTEDRIVNYVKIADAPDGNRVVYINWDGFARYYIDEAIKLGRNIPTIKNIIENEGVFFNNANTHIPSITNPTQQAIVSGTPPLFTDNHYRYFNKEQGVAIQEDPARKDEAETIAQSAVRQGLDVISINQFALEDKGTTSSDQRALYFDAGSTNGAATRFDAAIKMVKELKAGSFTLDQVPRFIALYMDDLDSLGHNESAHYGYSIADTEKGRMENVLKRIEEMDAKLGEFIGACKDAGIYDTMSFVLTADHGMASFGQQEIGGDTYTSSLDDMMAVIEALGDGYKCEVLSAGSSPATGTDIAIISVGLQAQLSYVGEFDPTVIAQKNEIIMQAIKNEVYVDVVLTPAQIQAGGVREGFADLLVSPKPPYNFKTGDYESVRIARGQHDSYNDTARKISALMWGKNIKKGVTINQEIYNTDFAATMSVLMGINAPLDSTGKVLYTAFDGILNPVEYKTTKVCSKGDCVTAVPETNRLEIVYSSLNIGKMQLNVNGKKVRDVFFPETNSRNKKMTKIINISLNEGDTVTLAPIDLQNSEDIMFNEINFYGTKNTTTNNNNSGGGSYSPPTVQDSIDSSAISNSISNAKNNVATIDISGKPIMSIEGFKELAKNPNTTLELKGDGYSWAFKGKDINPAKINGTTFNTQISRTSPNKTAIKALTGSAVIENVYFSYHGELPGKATMKIQTSFKSETVKLYYFNSAMLRLEYVSDAVVDANGIATFSINHCSDYIVSSKVISTAVGNPKTPNTKPTTMPKTSDNTPIVPIILMGIIGVAILLLSKKKLYIK
ncbi:MAG: alkaline phosphatase family protein [Oscillospiraceae bacterium]